MVLLLNILTVKLDSASENPVKNQGFNISVSVDLKFGIRKLGFTDREVYDLLNEAVINWLEGILI